MNDLVLIREVLLSFPETTEETPFGPDVAVYKVAGKMFATLSPDAVPAGMNLKCDPDLSDCVARRDFYQIMRSLRDFAFADRPAAAN